MTHRRFLTAAGLSLFLLAAAPVEWLPWGLRTLALPLATSVDQRVLAAGVAETVTVPAGCNYLFFSSDGDFYVRADGSAAAVPVADVTDGTGSARNPTWRAVRPAQQFSIVAGATRIVTMECFLRGVS